MTKTTSQQRIRKAHRRNELKDQSVAKGVREFWRALNQSHNACRFSDCGKIPVTEDAARSQS